MFGKRCTLCGGKLDGNYVCTECGLDNSRSDKKYQIGKSACDDGPLTHVHTEGKNSGRRTDGEYQSSGEYRSTGNDRNVREYQTAGTDRSAGKEQNVGSDRNIGEYQYAGKKSGQDRSQWVNHERKKERRASRRQRKAHGAEPGVRHRIRNLVIVILVFCVIGIIIACVSFNRDFFGNSSWAGEENPYEMIEDEGIKLSPYGEEASFSLASGRYIVGVHIPEGCYSAELENPGDRLIVNDHEHGIFLYEYPDKDGTSYLDDLRLFEGAVVELTVNQETVFTTQNAQPLAEAAENPLTESLTFRMEYRILTSGRDFAPGVYDISATDGSGLIQLTVYDEEGEEYSGNSIYLGENEDDGTLYRNLVIPAEATLEVETVEEDDFEIRMTPSRVIRSEDYLAEYEW